MILLTVPMGDVSSKRTAPLFRASTVKFTLTCSSRPIPHEPLFTVRTEEMFEPKSGPSFSGRSAHIRWAGTAFHDLARFTILTASMRPNPKDLTGGGKFNVFDLLQTYRIKDKSMENHHKM